MPQFLASGRSDLVHLGATFAPCMRHDPRIYAQIEADRALENETGCCVYNDGTGCFQTGEDTCPKVIASLVKWKVGATGPDGRTSGAVCGQDPRYCKDPPSVDPFEWPDDITKWPQFIYTFGGQYSHGEWSDKGVRCLMPNTTWQVTDGDRMTVNVSVFRSPDYPPITTQKFILYDCSKHVT
ncbi:Inactive rhomboid protein 1 [Toxocara canis]|uniref:Inactive rhomboid protein 1 n=1 Tax=Toxocara canis TaxID=6265 RepID=A0A0B2W5F4_TOXCA|nr:Inactive rhomboid protein 1 [Toxocara canis]